MQIQIDEIYSSNTFQYDNVPYSPTFLKKKFAFKPHLCSFHIDSDIYQCFLISHLFLRTKSVTILCKFLLNVCLFKALGYWVFFSYTAYFIIVHNYCNFLTCLFHINTTTITLWLTFWEPLISVISDWFCYS